MLKNSLRKQSLGFLKNVLELSEIQQPDKNTWEWPGLRTTYSKEQNFDRKVVANFE